ncbi:MAG: hypothetical protein KatS3mg008_0238 [Acidimicrobiales bacterium]|nr:MAG: hypothetical protein KatS3mg008_0238 [Acidimicrobiales bacterium]
MKRDDRIWLFDLTFLKSRWTCIWGRGCPGILDEPAPDDGIGCCSYGAHFTEKEDRLRVEKRAASLDPDLWQYKDVAESLGGPIHQNDEGEWVTRIVDDACIFLNRPGFPGGPGCALHLQAARFGEPPAEWKPEVCWQMPIRFEELVDSSGHLITLVRGWRRRDWGEGGADFHWWCVEEPSAYVGEQPVYEAMRDELVRLVGEDVYRRLTRHIENGSIVPLPELKSARAPADRGDGP